MVNESPKAPKTAKTNQGPEISMCCFGFWLVLVLCVLFSGMSGYVHTTTQRAKSRPCMVSSLNVTSISGVPHMFIFVRSLFPNVGWHDRVSYSDDCSKRVLGSDQRYCRKPTYYEACKPKKNLFLLQPAARVFSQENVSIYYGNRTVCLSGQGQVLDLVGISMWSVWLLDGGARLGPFLSNV